MSLQLYILKHKKVASYITFLVCAFICISYDIRDGIKLLVPNPPKQRFLDTNPKPIHNGRNFLIPDRSNADISSPSLMAGPNSTLILKPAMGSHRPDVDAVFASAEGLSLEIYVLFITSLRSTGFDGDIVLGVSPWNEMAPGVFEFLKYHAQTGLVVYEGIMRIDQKKEDTTMLFGQNRTAELFGDNVVVGAEIDSIKKRRRLSDKGKKKKVKKQGKVMNEACEYQLKNH